MNDFDTYKADHLFLLLGENPLPNFVAAQLFGRVNPKEEKKPSTLYLVHSKDTDKQRQKLDEVLRNKGYENIYAISLGEKESDKSTIETSIRNLVSKLSGVVGINYTGGTKAMSVHTYRTIEQLQRKDPTYYSYLDARTLQMQIEGTGITGAKSIPVDALVQVTLEELLRLHDRWERKKEMREEGMWKLVTDELAYIHTKQQNVKEWRNWCQQQIKKNNELLSKEEDIEKLTTDIFNCNPVAMRVGEALQHQLPNLSFPATFRQLAENSPLKIPDREFLKWFDGTWIEDYVFHCIDELREAQSISNLALTIEPYLPHKETKKRKTFEFDVVFIRGYQLFALSCTTGGGHKEKLLEAVIRAEQLGGSEARVGLVCLTDDVETLTNEVIDLLGKKRLRVFGRRHLPELQDELKQWIEEAGW